MVRQQCFATLLLLLSPAAAVTVIAQSDQGKPKNDGASQAAPGWPTESWRLATVNVVSAQPTELESDKSWSKIPDFLKGAKIYSHQPKGNELEFEATSDGIVIIAASWNYDGNSSGGWYESRTTPEHIVERGWMALVGQQILNGEKDTHQLYMRRVKAGDKVNFHTRRYNQPYLVLPKPDAVVSANIFRAQPEKAATAKPASIPSAAVPAPQTPAPAAPKTDAPADEIVVTGASPTHLTDESEWSPVPENLRGATIFRPATGNTLDLTANKEVQVVVAVSWAYDGNASGGWYDGRTSLPQLVAKGCKDKKKDPSILLRRTLRAGEKVAFHTRKNGPPANFLPAPEQRMAVARLAAIVVPSNNLELIRPPAGDVSATQTSVVLRTHEPDREDRFAERGVCTLLSLLVATVRVEAR